MIIVKFLLQIIDILIKLWVKKIDNTFFLKLLKFDLNI